MPVCVMTDICSVESHRFEMFKCKQFNLMSEFLGLVRTFWFEVNTSWVFRWRYDEFRHGFHALCESSLGLDSRKYTTFQVVDMKTVAHIHEERERNFAWVALVCDGFVLFFHMYCKYVVGNKTWEVIHIMYRIMTVVRHVPKRFLLVITAFNTCVYDPTALSHADQSRKAKNLCTSTWTWWQIRLD